MEKQELKEREAKIIEMAVAFCNEHLDEECAELCTKLVQKLGRKRSNPLHPGLGDVADIRPIRGRILQSIARGQALILTII